MKIGMQASYQIAANNIVMSSELSQVLRDFNIGGIPTIVLKGLTLATTVYPSVAHRPVGDIDLLIPQNSQLLAQSILEKQGYRFISEPKQRFNPFRSIATGEMAFTRSGQIVIDLHWELISIEWLRHTTALNLDVFWQDAQPFELDGIYSRQLSPHDLLLHLCLHLVVHNYAHPIGYNDIAQVLGFHRDLQWNVFLERAKCFRLRAACYFALETAGTVLGAPVPQDVIDSLQPSAWQRWLVYKIANPHQGLKGELHYTHPRSYLLHLAVADRFIDVMRVALWLLFPGPSWLAERYRLPGRWMPWLACFWNPFFVLWQGMLGLKELAH